MWGTFVPSALPVAGGKGAARRGVTILAIDLQSVIFYDSAGNFVGVRRPDGSTPIEVCFNKPCSIVGVRKPDGSKPIEALVSPKFE